MRLSRHLIGGHLAFVWYLELGRDCKPVVATNVQSVEAVWRQCIRRCVALP